jgi:hypothetical protein
MLDFHGYTAFELSKLRSVEIDRKLELARLAREGRVLTTWQRPAALHWLGSMLISWGEALQRRAASDYVVSCAE